MDGPRFDALARALARRDPADISRRQVLKSLGAALGGLFAAIGSHAADAAAAGRPGGSTCRKDGECASGLCGPKDATGRQRCMCALGDPCGENRICGGPAAACVSAICADGVCCDGACTGQCEACDVAGLVGTCSPVPAGTAPRGGRQACSGTGPCAATCDGTNRTTCAYPGATVSCGTTACSGDNLVSFSCDGAGTCAETVVDACSPYACRNGACLESCAVHDDCIGTAFCLGGACWAGQPCDLIECGSFCAGGMCTSEGIASRADPAGGGVCICTCGDGPGCGGITGVCVGGGCRCGSGPACGAGQRCCFGFCAAATEEPCAPPTGMTVCDNLAVNLQTDANNCGACNKHCFGGACVGGRCRCGDESCMEGETCSGGECLCCKVSGNVGCAVVEDKTFQCAFGEICDFTRGTCQCPGRTTSCPGVSLGETCIDGQCCVCPSGETVSLEDGACTCACGDGPPCGASGACVGGECGCGSDPVCGAGQRCSNGHCCPEGKAYCGGVCGSEPAACGDACIDCGDGATCSNGLCVCSSGAAPCVPKQDCCGDACCPVGGLGSKLRRP